MQSDDRETSHEHEKDPEREAVLAERKAWREKHPREKKKAKKVKVRSTSGRGGVRFTHKGHVPPPQS